MLVGEVYLVIAGGHAEKRDNALVMSLAGDRERAEEI